MNLSVPIALSVAAASLLAACGTPPRTTAVMGGPAVVTTALGDYPPTEAAEEVFELVTEQIEAEVSRFEALIDEELPKFNSAVKKAKLDAVITA